MCSTPYRFGGAHGGIGCNRESREITIANGKKRIQQLASALNLNHLVDGAHRLFLSAVQRNFVHGRKTSNVVAACLYIVCRQRNAPHLLIDFAEVLQTNVFVLGNCFLKFRKLLNLELPAVDPVHYIDRFAAKLELDDKTHDVAKTAHKLVARMKRDWIQTGRRPSGICGAALIIASRMHGFSRTQRHVVHIMKICDETLRKRLSEFEATPAGSLTVEEFFNVDLTEEADPPAFTRNRLKEDRLLTDETVEPCTAVVDITAMSNRERTMYERSQAQKSMYETLERELAESLEELETIATNPPSTQIVATNEVVVAAEVAVSNEVVDAAEVAVSNEVVVAAEVAVSNEVVVAAEVAVSNEIVAVPTCDQIVVTHGFAFRNQIVPPTCNQVTATDRVESCEPSAITSLDIDDILLSPEQAGMKLAIWKAKNKDFLEKEEQDRRDGKVKKKRKRKGRSAEDPLVIDPNKAPVEAIKKKSKKINYEALKQLFEIEKE